MANNYYKSEMINNVSFTSDGSQYLYVVTPREETAYYLSGFDVLEGSYFLVRSKVGAEHEAQISGYYFFDYLKRLNDESMSNCLAEKFNPTDIFIPTSRRLPIKDINSTVIPAVQFFCE